MTTIRIPVQANPLDLNQDGKVTLDELVRSAFWIVIWIVLGINALSFSLIGCAYVMFGWENWKGALSWSVIIFFASWGGGTIYAAWLSLNRMKRYERAEEEASSEDGSSLRVHRHCGQGGHNLVSEVLVPEDIEA